MTVGLVLLLGVAEVIHGFRVTGTPWLGGDLLYHQGLANEILRGAFPPGGPYAGLPSWYPPGFHVLLAGTMALTGLGAVQADQLLTLLWLPVLPIGTFLLARAVTGRPWIALLAAVLTVFAGAYDLNAGRLWVNSLFMAGHEAYPLYPRDLVFGVLPFAVLASIRAVGARRVADGVVWALAAGLLFGVAGLVQIQLLLPLPVAVVALMAVVAWREPLRRRQLLLVAVIVGALALALVAPWVAGQLEAIGRNGGAGLDLSDAAEPAAYGFWNYPREFGLLLPLGIVGAGVALLFLRRPDRPHPTGAAGERWRPNPPEAGVALVAWFAVAFGLGALYQPDWPFGDALRPQRMWLLASQPLAILAATGLVALAEAIVGGRWHRPRLVLPAVVAVVLVAALPATAATAWLVAGTWTTPTYAHLDLRADHVPDFEALFRQPWSKRQTVLTYEDWSSLVWYETGQSVVAVVPAGYAKLGYDPAIFTGHSQAARRADVQRAFSGDPRTLASVADMYGARFAIVAVRGGHWGLLDVPAALAGRSRGVKVVEGNGWDGVEMAPDSLLLVSLQTSGLTDLEIRVMATPSTPATVARHLDLWVVGSDGLPRGRVSLDAAPTSSIAQVLRAGISAAPGDTLFLAARDAVTVQSIRGFVAAGDGPPGWRHVTSTPDAVLLERVP